MGFAGKREIQVRHNGRHLGNSDDAVVPFEGENFAAANYDLSDVVESYAGYTPQISGSVANVHS